MSSVTQSARSSSFQVERVAEVKKHGVLLIDADGDSEPLVSKAAARAGRYMLLAKTSRDAFKILKDEMPCLDLVIVDVDPGAHGLALLEAISGCAKRPPMIVVTALEEAYMTSIATGHGAAACLGKPISIGKLGSTISDVSTRWALTCNRWGSLVPRPVRDGLNVERGIAAKLSPAASTQRKKRK